MQQPRVKKKKENKTRAERGRYLKEKGMKKSRWHRGHEHIIVLWPLCYCEARARGAGGEISGDATTIL